MKLWEQFKFFIFELLATVIGYSVFGCLIVASWFKREK